MKLVHWIAVIVLIGILSGYFLSGSAKPVAQGDSEAPSNQKTLLTEASPKPQETIAHATPTPFG